MTLSKASFSDNSQKYHFDTFGENFDFDTFKNDTFESVWVDRHPQNIFLIIVEYLNWNLNYKAIFWRLFEIITVMITYH